MSEEIQTLKAQVQRLSEYHEEQVFKMALDKAKETSSFIPEDKLLEAKALIRAGAGAKQVVEELAQKRYTFSNLPPASEIFK